MKSARIVIRKIAELHSPQNAQVFEYPARQDIRQSGSLMNDEKISNNRASSTRVDEYLGTVQYLVLGGPNAGTSPLGIQRDMQGYRRAGPLDILAIVVLTGSKVLRC